MKEIIKSTLQSRTSVPLVARRWVPLPLPRCRRQAGRLSYFRCDRIAELENGITAGIIELKGMLK